eukprot:766958-Hanusia_phi.AAC.4
MIEGVGGMCTMRPTADDAEGGRKVGMAASPSSSFLLPPSCCLFNFVYTLSPPVPVVSSLVFCLAGDILLCRLCFPRELISLPAPSPSTSFLLPFPHGAAPLLCVGSVMNGYCSARRNCGVLIFAAAVNLLELLVGIMMAESASHMCAQLGLQSAVRCVRRGNQSLLSLSDCAEEDFLTITRRKDARLVTIKKPRGGRAGPTKFKVRCSKYRYTYVVADNNKASKLKLSLPPSLKIKEVSRCELDKSMSETRRYPEDDKELQTARTGRRTSSHA